VAVLEDVAHQVVVLLHETNPGTGSRVEFYMVRKAPQRRD